MRQMFGKLGWKAAALVGLIGLLVFVRYGPGLAPRSVRVKQVFGPGELTAIVSHGNQLEFNPANGVLRASGPQPSFVLKDFSALSLPPVSHIRLRLRPLAAFNVQDFLIYYVSRDGPETDFDSRFPDLRTLRGYIEDAGAHQEIVWDLPMPAVKCRLHVPEKAQFQVVSLELVGEEGPDAQPAVNLLPLALLAFLVLLLVRASRHRWIVDSPWVKNALLVGLALQATIVIFLLPPFQGPDEWLHWKDALIRYRPDARQELPLYNLPDILDGQRLKHHPENQLPPAKLRADAGHVEPDLVVHRMAYGSFVSYPVVGLVSLVLPQVQTLREALFFYHLCRVVPLVLLFTMLLWANRAGWLPYVAIVFFSSPYVLQQVMVVSTDTLANLGTLLATLLFLRLQRRRSLWLGICLALACAAVFLVKPPIYAGALLLPIVLIPYRRIQYSRSRVLLAGVLLLALVLAGAWGLWKGWQGVRGAQSAAQLQFLATAEGMQAFFAATLSLLRTHFADIGAWFSPLGWADTALNPYHITLILWSCLAALSFDLLGYAPSLPAGWRESRGRAALVAAIILVNFVVAGLCICLVMYVGATPLRAASIAGVQVRYLFPPAIIALLLPMAVLRERAPSRLSGLVPMAALCLLALLLFARQIELVSDLLSRYW